MALKPNEQELLNRVQSGLGIGGTWQPSTTGATLDVHDPATGEVIKSIADATVEDAVRALDAAVLTEQFEPRHRDAAGRRRHRGSRRAATRTQLSPESL